ncbi:MAG: TetR/AcrR family transcriptional regulator [bacterium]|nr:TetR/AcrR family transcriptional regulator [bacterium]
MQKKPELTEQTKRNLAEAFLNIYDEKDISRISVKEIAEHAGYNRSTFYSYFDNVQDVLDYVVDSLFEQAKKIGEFHMEHKECSAAGRTADLTDLSPDEDFVRFYKENSKVLTIMFHKVRTPIFTQRLREWIQPECEQFLNSLPEKERLEMTYVLEYHISGLFAILAKWYKEEKNLTINEVWNLIARINNQGTLSIMREVLMKNK